MKKYITLVITDKPNTISIVNKGKSKCICAAEEIEIVKTKEEMMVNPFGKKTMSMFKEWAEEQIKQFPKF